MMMVIMLILQFANQTFSYKRIVPGKINMKTKAEQNNVKITFTPVSSGEEHSRVQAHMDGDEFSAHILTDEAEYNVEVIMKHSRNLGAMWLRSFLPWSISEIWSEVVGFFFFFSLVAKYTRGETHASNLGFF